MDRGIALLAGRDAWADAEAHTSAITRTAATVEVAAFMTAASSIWMYRLTRNYQYESIAIRLAPLGFTIVCMLLSATPARVAIGRTTRTPDRHVFVLPRAAMALALVATAYAVVPGWSSLIAWPVGVALGADAALTSWALGWELLPLRWWTMFLISPVHVGVIGGLIGAVVYQGWSTAMSTGFPVYISMHLWVILASGTAWWLSRLLRLERRDQKSAVADAASFEHRRSAHWLHDDLCAQLRLVSIRVQSGGVTMPEVATMLDELDHQMRLRQLDEIFESGSARIAEVLQPYVRRAQNHGVAIDSTPSFDDAALVISAHAGREFSHASAILTSNALNAGATHLSFEVCHSPGCVSIAVIDDAGGIPMGELPIGRGLWRLRHHLGHDRLTFTPTATGTRVQATIALTDRSPNDAAAAR